MNLRESFKKTFGRVQEGKVEVGGASSWDIDGESPVVDFAKCVYYYQHDARIKLAVDSYTELIMGLDFVINSKDERATKLIKDFAENTDLHTKIKGAVLSMLACGESLIEKYGETGNPLAGVDEVDIRTITDKPRDKYGNTLKYVQEINGEKFDLQPVSKFVNFQLNPVAREAWAKPLAYPLIAPRALETGYDTSVPAPIETIWEAEDAMGKIFNKHAEPEEIYTFEGASKEFLTKMKQKFRERKRGEKIFTDRKFEKDVNEVNPQSKFGDYMEHLDQIADLSTQFSPQIFSAEFTARASSETTDSVISRKVKSLRKYVLWKVKNEIFFPLLQLNGYESADMINAIELEIGVEEPEITSISTADANAAYQSGVISKEEYRDILKKRGAELSEEEIPDVQTEAYQKIIDWIGNDKKVSDKKQRK